MAQFQAIFFALFFSELQIEFFFFFTRTCFLVETFLSIEFKIQLVYLYSVLYQKSDHCCVVVIYNIYFCNIFDAPLY